MIAREGNHLMADVLVVLPLHPAPMRRVRAAVRERIAMVDVHAEHLDASICEGVLERVDHALALEFPLIAAAGRKDNHRRTPVTVDDDPHVASEAIGVPPMMVVPHGEPV